MDTGDGVADWVIHIDDFDEGVLNGWGLDRQRPDVPYPSRFYRPAARSRSSRREHFRPDLAAAGYGNGRHGFSADISHWDLAGNTVTVRPVGVDDPEHATLISTDLAASLTGKSWSHEYLKMLDDLAAPFVTADDA